jgi:hypothetical protein
MKEVGMGLACGTHREEGMCFYTGFVDVIDGLEELVVDGISVLVLEFFGSECFM